nr:hypothetical protein [Clostridia bacterium]
MKYVWLLLPVAAIVLLVLSMLDKGENPNLLLCGGMLCSSLGLWLNIWFQRRERKEKQ